MKEEEGIPVAFSASSMKARKIVGDLLEALMWCGSDHGFDLKEKQKEEWKEICEPALIKALKWFYLEDLK